MKDDKRLDDAVSASLKRISQTSLPAVSVPASKWDVAKSTATTVTAVVGAMVLIGGLGDRFFERIVEAAERKAVDAGARVERVAADLEAHKLDEAQRLRGIEAKLDEQAADSRALYRAVMYAQPSARLEAPAPPRDAGR